MTWTKKHAEFAMQCKLRQSTTRMLHWILCRAKLNEVSEIEIDLRVFNAWVAKKRGSPYDRKTISEAVAQLDELTQGMIIFTKRYTPWVHKIIVRPLSFVLATQTEKLGEDPKVITQKPMFDAEHKKRLALQQQQDISKLDNIFRELGMIYKNDALVRIWRLAGKSITEVKNAIELMIYEHSTSADGVRKAHGWLISCLTNGWQKGLNLYYQVKLPQFSSVQEIDNFVGGIFDRNQIQYQT